MATIGKKTTRVRVKAKNQYQDTKGCEKGKEGPELVGARHLHQHPSEARHPPPVAPERRGGGQGDKIAVGDSPEGKNQQIRI